MKKLMLLLGCICLSLIFVSSAVGKLFSWNETIQYLTTALSLWTTSTTVPAFLHSTVAMLASRVPLLLVISTILEGVGGLFVLLGFRVRLGAVMLILFILPVTLIMHPFWMTSGPEKLIQMSMFMKNLSILGGLLILAAKNGDSEG